MNNKGFTLRELLVCVGIFAVISSLTFGAFAIITKTNKTQSAVIEVSDQMNFVLWKVQQLFNKSLSIDIDAGVTVSSIKLTMPDSAKNPTSIYLADGVVKIIEGSNSPVGLTDPSVTVNTLNFKKITLYPGHDILSLDMAMVYNSDNPDNKVSRSLSSAIKKASAATFDSNLLPGTDAEYEVGFSGQRWKNVFISNLLNVGQLEEDPTSGMQNGSIYYNTSNNNFRGYEDGAWNILGGSSQWTSSSTDIYYNTGNVGIGTAAPNASLDLGSKTDGIILPNGTTAQRDGSPSAGTLRYNSTLSKLEFYNGSIWRTYSDIVDSDFNATGGTITEVDGYRIHTFTGSGTFTVTGSGNVEVLVVAGGGSGGNHTTSNANGGGGGGGVIYNSSYSVSTGPYTVTIGNGGVAVPHITCAAGNNGENSVFGTLTAIGGGGGGSTGGYNGSSGGSGGGGAYSYPNGGASTQGDGGYGNAGGSGAVQWTGAGGGGAGSVGNTGAAVVPGGDGGRGYPSTISGKLVRYGGGGGGGGNTSNHAGDGYDGGGRSFGATSFYDYNKYFLGVNGVTGGSATPNAIPNTGGGGGAGSYWAANGGWWGGSGAGGSGIVIVRYRISTATSFSATGGNTTEVGGYRIHTFLSSGAFTVTGSGNVEVLVVAGGGSGGNSNTTNANGGGGGGGVVYNSSYSVSTGSYSVIVGNGGFKTRENNISKGQNGENSVFGTLTAIGGGGGGSTGGYNGSSGGSGGGGAYSYPNGGASTQGDGGYGNAGGSGAVAWTGAGGGGAGSIGVAGSAAAPGGNGGTGYASSISGTTKYYGGGGGGGANSSQRAGDGYHGGGRGVGTTSYYNYNVYIVETNGTTGGSGTPDAIPNTGGGGGGGSYTGSSVLWWGGSGAGGSGIVIIRYPI